MLKLEKHIILCLAHMSGNEQKYIKEAFDTNWVVPLGPNVNGFEEDLKRFVASTAALIGRKASRRSRIKVVAVLREISRKRATHSVFSHTRTTPTSCGWRVTNG